MLLGVLPVAVISRPREETVAHRDSSNPFRTGRTLIIPHNGGDGERPADTLAAYTHSMAVGGDVVDIDVAMSSDGVLVALHDTTTDAVTGVPGEVAKTRRAKLASLDAGWGFATGRGGHPFRGVGLRIPSVRDVLDRFPHAVASLDLKHLGMDMVQPVCDLLRATGRLSSTFVGSKSVDQINLFRAQCPGVHTAFDPAEERALRAAQLHKDSTYAAPALVDQPAYADHGVTLVTPALVAYAHEHNIAIMTWVVDDEATLARLVNMHVDGIYTRKPALLAGIIRKFNKSRAARAERISTPVRVPGGEVAP